MSFSIGFIGGGNMARAILTGAVTDYPKSKLFVADRHQANRDYFSQQLGITACKHFSEFIQKVDLLILAIKPQGFPELFAELRPHIKESLSIISIAAGVTTTSIQQGLGLTKQPVIRVMPNTPATINLGASALYATKETPKMLKEFTDTLFSTCGITVWVPKEEQLSAAVAVSGSSPAYFFYIMEIMTEMGVNLGLTPESSALLTKQSLLGAARYSLKSEESLATLKQNVISPNGTTEAAIKSFLEDDLAGTIQRGMEAAAKRDRMLSEEIATLLTTTD